MQSSHLTSPIQLTDFFRSGSLWNAASLADALRPHCKNKRLGIKGSRLRIIQVPEEFSHWLLFLRDRQVKSYLEVGTSTGGSFYAVDSFLRATVSGFHRSVGYDRTSKMRDWKQYSSGFPSTEFRHASSDQMNLIGEHYDAAFIDACHLEHWVLHDFEKVRPHSKIIGFHDIVLTNSTACNAWAKIKHSCPRAWEFIATNLPAEARMGIGVVETGA